MSLPDPPPRFQALRVGPGGIPPEHVRPVPSERFAPLPTRPPMGEAQSGPPPGRPGAPPGSPPPGSPAPGSSAPQQMWPLPPPPAGPSAGPSAVLGSFDEGQPRPSRRAAWGWIALTLAAAVIVATALWSSTTPRAGGAAPAPGDCLSSDGEASSVLSVDCGSVDADFRVIARYDGAGGAASCATVHSDLVMIADLRSVLCLDYVARIGECLFAGAGDSTGAGEIGKRPCGDAYRGTRDLYRVLAVLPGATDDSACPAGTLQTLMHREPREIVCLGFP